MIMTIFFFFFIYSMLFMHAKTSGRSHMFEKIHLVDHYGFTTGQFISMKMKAERVIKILNSWNYT